MKCIMISICGGSGNLKRAFCNYHQRFCRRMMANPASGACRYRCTLHSCVDGSLISDEMWGIYYKPDWHFNGIQGGASPYKVDTEVDKVAIDPYGPSSPEFVASDGFAHMWVSALAHCHKRFEGMMGKYHREASGGIGCFTADSFPVFDHFHDNATFIADSNHGWNMIGVGHLIAEELLGDSQEIL